MPEKDENKNKKPSALREVYSSINRPVDPASMLGACNLLI